MFNTFSKWCDEFVSFLVVPDGSEVRAHAVCPICRIFQDRGGILDAPDDLVDGISYGGCETTDRNKLLE